MHLSLLVALAGCGSHTETAPPTPTPPPPPPPSPFVEATPVQPDQTPAAKAFAEAWRLVDAEDYDGAASHLQPDLDVGLPGYQAYVRGRVQLSRGEAAAAAESLALVDADSAIAREATAWRARALEEDGKPDLAAEAYRVLIADPDPSPGTAQALGALATTDQDAAWRLYTAYPGTPEDGEAGRQRSGEPTAEQAIARAAALMGLGSWDAAIALVDAHLADLPATGPVACQAHYVRGRCLYKRNKRSAAEAALKPSVAACEGNAELGPKAGYLRGRVSARRGNHRTAAGHYVKMSEAWPEHRYADDGFVLAGISLERAGDVAGARKLWRRALEELPDGDMTPEGAFRLAFSLYDGGDGIAASGVAAELGALDVNRDRFHVPAGRYWSARWALYPDVSSPNTPREEGRQQALDGWQDLVAQQPWSYYAVLAHMRLVDEAPDTAEAPTRPEVADAPWTLRRELYESPAADRARKLLALGLVSEARDEWALVDADALTESEVLWWSESRSAAGDWIEAHRETRVWLRTHLPTAPDADAVRRLEVAYPDHWLPEVRQATEERKVPPRYFHALVRVESNFDAQAISWAGARGLSQVMPTTGKRVGKWIGLDVGKPELLDPTINLAVGTKYMDYLFDMFDGSPFLSAGGYNAGEHRIVRWVDELGNPPTDEFVERIPFDETRGYVKRVVGTWQTYHWLRDSEPPFPDLSRYAKTAHPGAGK